MLSMGFNPKLGIHCFVNSSGIGLNHINHLSSKMYAWRHSQVYVIFSHNTDIQCQAWDSIPTLGLNIRLEIQE